MATKPLCKWKPKEIEARLVELVEVVSKGKRVCRKCARVAVSEDYLCKPVKLKSVKKTNSAR